MLNLERKTNLSKEEVKKRLRRFFGEEGLGLELKEETPQCLSYGGAGGYVTANICSEKGKIRLDLVTQEWEYQVKKFAASLP